MTRGQGRIRDMLGAIIGDIVGSRFEWHNIKTKEFDFFSPECFFTDDSVMTIALAEAILASGGQYGDLGRLAVGSMRALGIKYGDRGYGGMFKRWLASSDPKPYHSFGNGAAMRVSPCGFAAKTLEEAVLLSRLVTEVTHDHPEGIKGAEATAAGIFLARTGHGLAAIRDHLSRNYYPLDFTLDSIRSGYAFNETCQETVPQAIEAFLESSGFEDAIRGAISIGGDSDTLAAITGGLAEAFYGLPDDLARQGLDFLDPPLARIVDDFRAAYPRAAQRPPASD
ncbi:MAG: ADP-ribosylglycohydrolase family protein [Deltaproteobacteria bacterium]|jgi:type I restriction enzyme M protein|nr:ADP-ribosylglycohydrolase family protein [Deltaproteobacteria bacterium]